MKLLQIADGAFSSQVLFAANDLGVFEHLGTGPKTAPQLAALSGAPDDAMERLLNAAVATGLLQLHDEGYANSDSTEAFLARGGDQYLGNWIRLMSRWSHTWIHLREAILSGKPVQDPPLYAGHDPDFARDFTMGMHDYTQIRGTDVVEHVDLASQGRMLDVGSGPATYAILFAQKWPNLHVTVFDLPNVISVARDNVGRAGMADRISMQEGDFLIDDFQGSFDCVFMSDVLQEEPEDCARMLAKAHRALRPGGRIVVQDMFLDKDRTGPRWSVMLSLFLLLGRGKGRTYTVDETVDFLQGAGFHDCEHTEFPLSPVSMVVAEK